MSHFVFDQQLRQYQLRSDIKFSNGLRLKEAMKRIARALFSPFAGNLASNYKYIPKQRPAEEVKNEYLPTLVNGKCGVDQFKRCLCQKMCGIKKINCDEKRTRITQEAA